MLILNISDAEAFVIFVHTTFFFRSLSLLSFGRFVEKICNGIDKEIYGIERNHCIVKIGRISFSLKKAMIPLSIWFYDVINLSLPLFFCRLFHFLVFSFSLTFDFIFIICTTLVPLVSLHFLFNSIDTTRSSNAWTYKYIYIENRALYFTLLTLWIWFKIYSFGVECSVLSLWFHLKHTHSDGKITDKPTASATATQREKNSHCYCCHCLLFPI